MGKQISAVAVQREHEQSLCVQSRRRNVIGRKSRDRGGKGGLQLHRIISPQRRASAFRTGGAYFLSLPWKLVTEIDHLPDVMLHVARALHNHVEPVFGVGPRAEIGR